MCVCVCVCAEETIDVQRPLAWNGLTENTGLDNDGQSLCNARVCALRVTFRLHCMKACVNCGKLQYSYSENLKPVLCISGLGITVYNVLLSLRNYSCTLKVVVRC